MVVLLYVYIDYSGSGKNTGRAQSKTEGYVEEVQSVTKTIIEGAESEDKWRKSHGRIKAATERTLKGTKEVPHNKREKTKRLQSN